jgi:hypothetical protein
MEFTPTTEVRHVIKGRITKWESYSEITNAAGENLKLGTTAKDALGWKIYTEDESSI